MSDYARLDEADAARFAADGYLLKRHMLTDAEIELANRVIQTDPAIQGSRLKLADAAGGSTELALWNHPGDATCSARLPPAGASPAGRSCSWAARRTIITRS